MYHEPLITICRTDNGFILELRKPIERSVVGEAGLAAGYDAQERSLSIKTTEEAIDVVTRLLPLLTEPSAKDEFDTAFEEIVK